MILRQFDKAHCMLCSVVLVISFWLLVGSCQWSVVSGQSNGSTVRPGSPSTPLTTGPVDKKVDKDLTELTTLTNNYNKLRAQVMNLKISLYDRKKQVETDEKNLEQMNKDMDVLDYLIKKQKELIALRQAQSIDAKAPRLRSE